LTAQSKLSDTYAPKQTVAVNEINVSRFLNTLQQDFIGQYFETASLSKTSAANQRSSELTKMLPFASSKAQPLKVSFSQVVQ
jgi:hypothetical protein